MKLANNPPPTTSEPFRLSVSSVRLYQSCPRKFAFRYCDGIEAAKEPDDGIKFGTAVHKAIEVNGKKPLADWRLGEAVQGLDVDLAALVTGTVLAYGAYWRSSMRYTALELELTAELRNPRLQCLTILDGIAETDGGDVVVVDHKTTEKSDIRPGSWYYEKLALDLQVALYIWAARRNGLGVSHAIWDVIRKPRLERRADAIAPEYYARSGKWGKAGDTKPGTGLPAESPAEFADRVRRIALESPAEHFQRADVALMNDELDEAVADFEQVGEQILACWDAGRFPRNTTACMAWGRRCEFLSICDGSAQPTDTHLFQIRRRRDADAGQK